MRNKLKNADSKECMKCWIDSTDAFRTTFSDSIAYKDTEHRHMCVVRFWKLSAFSIGFFLVCQKKMFEHMKSMRVFVCILICLPLSSWQFTGTNCLIWIEKCYTTLLLYNLFSVQFFYLYMFIFPNWEMKVCGEWLHKFLSTRKNNGEKMNVCISYRAERYPLYTYFDPLLCHFDLECRNYRCSLPIGTR